MIPNTMPEIIADLYKRHAELERRFENRKRKGTVSEIDIPKGLARVKLGEDKDGKPYLSPWMPWKEVSMGAIKTHFPPSVGEHVEIDSESGDLTDGVISTSLPSNTNQRPHDKAAEGVITVGDTRIEITGGKVTITSPEIVLKANVLHLGDTGGKPVHRKDDVDSDGDVAVGHAMKVFAV